MKHSSDASPRPALQSPESSGRVSPRRRNALLIALGVACAASAVTWLTVVLMLATPRHKLLVLGDSYTIAHRVKPGGRLEDWLARDLGKDWVTHDLGQSNAHMGDHYLELCEAEFVRFRPDVVVLGLSSHKLIPDDEQQWRRFRNHAINLRWLPWNAEGLRLFRTLDGDERAAAVVLGAGLLFGFYDALDNWFDEHVTRPRKLAAFLHRDRREHGAEVARCAKKLGDHWEQQPIGSYEQVRQNQETQDLEFLLAALRDRHIAVVAALLPQGNEEMLQQYFSAPARAKLETSYRYTLRICRELGLPVVDFNAPEQRTAFGAAQWDDTFHLKSAQSYQHIAHGVAEWIAQHVSLRHRTG